MSTALPDAYAPHAEAIFVISKVQEGFRVHSPESGQIFMVGHDLDHPVCTCPEFSQHRHDPSWACAHVDAVRTHVSHAPVNPGGRAVRTSVDGNAQLTLKRSVSPDGRIDSLSVELSCPVDLGARHDVTSVATRGLGMQAEIVQGFLGRPQNGNGRPARTVEPPVGGNGSTPAELIGIAGMNTRYGRRLFLNVRCNGKVLKLFGNEKRLAEAIAGAGFPEAADCIEEGISLNLPCRVTTKPSEDRRYLNVDTVYPINGTGVVP